MAETLLTIVQKFCERTGLRRPSAVASSTDSQLLQIKGLADEICEDLSDQWTWETLIREATFTTLSGEDQGAITTIAPNGFLEIIDETIFNRTQKIPVYGPLGPQAWQQAKAFVPTGPLHRYRLRGGRLLFNPVGVAGHTAAFEYKSSYIIYNPVDAVYKSNFTKDTDEFLLDYKLLLLGLRWKWKAEKGLPYAEEFRVYQDAASKGSGRSGTKPRVALDGTAERAAAQPMIVIPPGSWNL